MAWKCLLSCLWRNSTRIKNCRLFKRDRSMYEKAQCSPNVVTIYKRVHLNLSSHGSAGPTDVHGPQKANDHRQGWIGMPLGRVVYSAPSMIKRKQILLILAIIHLSSSQRPGPASVVYCLTRCMHIKRNVFETFLWKSKLLKIRFAKRILL